MFRPLKYSHQTPHRRGTSFILIVVVMLSLFSAVGTAYALFAMREAKLAQQRKYEQGGGSSTQLKAPDPTDTINQFFSALVFDKGNNNSDLLNGMRGHSIGRSMYGYDGQTLNTTPWNGVGTFHELLSNNGYTVAPTDLANDRANCVNYTVMTIGGKLFLLDPEYKGVRPLDASGLNLLAPPTTASSTYIAKNAGYSYPDLKDFFMGYRDAATGEVFVPSFHRPWLFGSLDASNPNWTNDTGKLLTLRPRPQEHPNFPRVPPNQVPFGQTATYTGDVKNLTGAPGGNDSIWINLGLPVITLPNNRKVQPLVAVLVLPLNGCLDVNSHGNLLGGAQKSNQGLGPWEVSLSSAVTASLPATDAQKIISGRNPQYPLNPTTTVWQPQQRVYATATPPLVQPIRGFDPFSPINAPLPNYAPIAWDGSLVTAPAYATGLSGVPTFTNFQTTNTAVPNHPSLHNPSEWPSTDLLTSRTYPLSDIKRLHLRYAPTPDWISQAALADPNIARNSLVGSGFTLVTAQQTPNAYRLDPRHTLHGLFTTRSFDLARPKLVPSYIAGSLQLTPPNPTDTFYPRPAPLTLGGYPQPQNVLPGGDFQSATQWFNKYAALGAIDLNRPLTDYRNLNAAPNVDAGGNPTPQPISAGNMANSAQADSDRQQLARDIFIRLAVATGAAIDVTITGGNVTYQFAPAATVGTPPFNALRYLAQLAVNMVDYIDNDDISTRFAWHPTDANQVVFGVEKPRLVINEVYSEITNNPTDPVVDEPMAGMKLPLTNAQAHVRFWLELLNPSSTPATANGPLGTGGVPVNAYRVEIARVQGAPPTPYWRDPSNTTGEYSSNPATKADIVYQFTQGVTVEPNYNSATPANSYNPAGDRTKGIFLIGPELNQTEIAKKTVPNTTPPVPYEFNPESLKANPPWSNAAFVPYAAPMAGMANNNMLYTTPMPAAANLATDFKRHIVLLRRLANPYVAEGPNNPYITVDMMDHVPSFDGVARADGDRDARTPRAANPTLPLDAKQFDALANRFAVGKVQPYAGYAAIDTTSTSPYNTYTFTNANAALSSMVLDQKTANGDTQPKHTFGRQNGQNATQPADTATLPTTATETIMLPFDWLVHMDRPLVNQLELLQVRDTPSHLVTDYFVRQQGTNLDYEGGYPRWLDNGFSRAFEYLTVRSRTWGVGHGGRVPGLINVNAITDQRVLNAVLDTQGGTGNTFDSTTFVNGLWPQTVGQTTWMSTRSTMQPKQYWNQTVWLAPVLTPAPNSMQNPTPPGPGVPAYVPTSSKTDAPTSSTSVDSPFFPFGAPFAAPDTTNAIAYQTGSNIDQTILRRAAPIGSNPPQPYLFTNQSTKKASVTYPATQPDGPSYYRAEPARKMLNNITTVNHQYVVFLTIGYFDADVVNPVQVAPNVSIPRLGAEAFISIPGDMRQKVVAVVDMSNMALRADSQVNGGDPIATETPFFTSLEATAYGNGVPTATLSIASSRFVPGATVAQNQLGVATTDGQEVAVGGYLVIGYGSEEQVVQVTGIPGPGQVSVQTVGGVPFRTAWGGTCVSNVRPGFPGPQPSFNYTDPKYKGVLPFVERLR